MAIDPGTTQSAFAYMSDEKVLGQRGILPNEELLDLIGGSRGCRVAIEMVQARGMAVGNDTFQTVFWIGRFAQQANSFDLIYRSVVKQALCDDVTAKDSNIRAALIDLLGPPGTRKKPGPTFGITQDIWQAVALGVTWFRLNKKKVDSEKEAG